MYRPQLFPGAHSYNEEWLTVKIFKWFEQIDMMYYNIMVAMILNKFLRWLLHQLYTVTYGAQYQYYSTVQQLAIYICMYVLETFITKKVYLYLL